MAKAAGGMRMINRKRAAKTAARKQPIQSLITWPKKAGGFIGPKPRVLLDSKIYREPSAGQRTYTTGAPQFNGGKPICVRHREYLQPIIEVTAFTGTGRYIVQPGLADNFPWLAQIAGSFEQYKIKNLRYVYRNRISTAGNAAVYIAMQYDTADPEFKSIDEIMTYGGARSEVVWKDFSYNADLKRSEAYKKYFVRTDVLSSGQDSQLYDMAYMTICAVGGSAGAYCGDLLVEYDIEFYNPKMNPALLGAYGVYGNLSAANLATFVAGPWAGYNAVKASYFPSAVQEPNVNESTRKITFPLPGTYDVTYAINDPGSTATISNIAGNMWTVDTPGSAILSPQPITNVPASGSGWATAVKVAVVVANAVITMRSLAGSGTASGSVTSMLRIAVEAAPFVLSLLGTAPVPPLDDLTYRNLRKCYPKYNLSAFERKRQVAQFEIDHQEFKRMRRLEIEAVIAESKAEDEKKEIDSRTEEILKITLDDSGSDVEVNVSRSSSREPGSKKSKKTDLKSRKV